MKGIVIKNTGSWYTVRTDNGQCIDCKVKGNFRLKGIRSTNPVAIGDQVEILMQDNDTALITQISQRKNYIIRKSINLSKQTHILAANLDQCLLIVTISQPTTSTTFIDRFLATAEAYNIPTTIIFNKTDIYTPQDHQHLNTLTTLYQSIGYKCISISAQTKQGINTLKAELQDKVTLLSGNSGVGKSTIINQLIPDLNIKTANISQAYNTGRHTTTYSQMYQITPNSYIIDTPGIKGFGTIDMKKEEVGHYFKEIFQHSQHCRFNNCTHTHEPGCAVITAVSQNQISQTRYQSYLSILNDENEDKYRSPY